MKNGLLAIKLKELHKSNNYMRDYAASILGLVRQSYSHYETEKHMPNSETLYKLAYLYNILIDDLMQLITLF